MENFENFWSTTITELIKTFEDKLIKDLGQVYPVTPLGKPITDTKQHKTLTYLVGESNLFQRTDRRFVVERNYAHNNLIIPTSLGKKHLRLTLDRLYIKVKDMLQPPSQGNNFEDLEPQQSWAQPEQSAPIISTESQAMIIDSKEKQGSIQKVTCDNNIVHESQNRQRRTIMVYDVPTKWSSDKIRSAFSDWGRVLNISLKTQHKYYTIRVDIVLNPTKDTEFILMPWCTQLGGIWVRWFPGEWKLAQRKSREIFQASFPFPADTTEDAIYSKFTPDGESLLQHTRAAAWKVIKDKQGLKGILYFETHERLMRALTLQTDKIKLTNSRTPLPIKSKKNKDKQSDSTRKTRQSNPPKQVQVCPDHKKSKVKKNKSRKKTAASDDLCTLLKSLIQKLDGKSLT
ncbi:hypothetical protein RclHR1_16280004 [Rhizophagus clarus]|uniref:RRM domain-containing protein n=1 Tax=Rhizophagus clarus TaxID=94130 RepID=A0A2Z6QWG3_9GLOM|nr:hypothetical protein RclHR1_16280004 [Rhizophagus clarus]